MIAPPLHPAAEVRLQELFHAIAEPVCREYGVTLAELGSRRKHRAVVAARGKIIERCRQRIYMRRAWRYDEQDVFDGPAYGCFPISTPHLARLLGLKCHSTVVLYLKRMKDEASGVPTLTGPRPFPARPS